MPSHSGALTHCGKKRTKNEDFFCLDETIGAYVLCDGVGGSHHSGEVASKTAAEHWLTQIRKWEHSHRTGTQPSAPEITASLDRMVQETNRTVCEIGGAATTFEALWLQGNTAWLCHVGDSRTYLIRNGELHRLTEDHTFESEWIRSGTYTVEIAKRSPYAKTLTQALGAQKAVKLDIRRIELMPDDRLLLCSDGLTSMLSGTEILQLVHDREQSLSKTVQALVEQANHRGGLDNITVILVEAPRSTNKLSAQVKVKAVEQVPFFQGLEYADLLKLLEIAELETFRPGQALTEEGTPGDEMFVMIAGEVDVSHNGKFIGVRPSGSTIGEMGVFGETTRSATVTARDEVTALVFTQNKLISLLKANPGLLQKVMWRIVGHLSALVRKLSSEG